MRFELFKGLILLPITFVYNTTEISALGLVDTGSAGTALDINLVNMDLHQPSQIVEIFGVGGSQDVVIQEVEHVKFGGHTVSKLEVEFGDIATKFGFNAIIGSNLLDALGACVDYKRKEIRLSSDG